MTKPGDRLRQRAEDFRSGKLRWVQGNPVRGRACLLIGGMEPDAREIRALCPAGGAASSVDLIQWNDTPGRTVAEVIDALERAADLLDAEA